MIANPTAKYRFQESQDSVSKHRQMVDSKEFQRAADFAMLHYSAILSKQVSGANDAIAVGLKLLGAHEFLQELRNMSEVPKEPSKITRLDNLNHNV